MPSPQSQEQEPKGLTSIDDLREKFKEMETGGKETPTPAPEPEAAQDDPSPAPEPQAEPKQSPEAEPEVEASGEAEPSPYDPNLKFTVLDEEHEIPEYMKQVIADEEREKEIRELYEKAYGLDHVKEKYKNTKTRLEEINNKYQRVETGLKQLQTDLQEGNLDQVFKKLNLSDDKVLQWVADKVKYEEMDPEERARVDQARQAEEQQRQLATQNKTLQEQAQEAIVNAKRVELQAVMSRPDVQAFEKQFDERLGKGAFQDAVLKQGELAFHLEQKDISVEDAVKRVFQLTGTPFGQTTQEPATPPTQSQDPKETQQTQNSKVTDKVIPNIEGSPSSSPVGTKPKSIDDLKKLYNQMAG